MTEASEAALRELRLRYNSACAAYQQCVTALIEAPTGSVALSDLLAKEARALRELTQARAELLAAMVQD